MSERFDLSDPAQHAAGLEAAAEAIRKGELIVLPTDTVYGVGADAFTPWAVSRLLAAKGRGRDMPPPVLVGTVRAATALVDDFGPFGQDLIDEFWPGGLTLVARATPTLAWDLGETRGTVAVRMPLHAAALDLLKKTGPMAVSSANTTGRPAATTADEAMEQLGDSVAVYLDGGPCGGGVASTIIDLTGSVPRLLRAGAISMDRLREVAALVTGEEVSPPGSVDGTAGIPDTSDPSGVPDSGLPDGPPDIPSDSPADARADALTAPASAATPGVPAGEPEAPAEQPEAPAEQLMQDAAEGQRAADDPAAPVTSESATAAPATPRARKPASPRKPATRKTPASTRKPPARKTPAPKVTDEGPGGEDPAGEPVKTTGKAATNREPAAERTATRRTAARKTTPADPPTLGDQTDTASQPGGTQPDGPA
jgi:tRNA threonylcarbamoyl adenosine modification protein (Sua5/YciO/YrdC/YwlC family)